MVLPEPPLHQGTQAWPLRGQAGGLLCDGAVPCPPASRSCFLLWLHPGEEAMKTEPCLCPGAVQNALQVPTRCPPGARLQPRGWT